VKTDHVSLKKKDCHEANTRQNILHMCQVNLTRYGKGVYHTAIMVFNGLPNELKEISDNSKTFKSELKEFLYSNSFYTLEAFFNS
jgi:hypothetical protein